MGQSLEIFAQFSILNQTLCDISLTPTLPAVAIPPILDIGDLSLGPELEPIIFILDSFQLHLQPFLFALIIRKLTFQIVLTDLNIPQLPRDLAVQTGNGIKILS